MARHENIVLGKAVIEDLYMGTGGGTQVTSTAAELNILDGVTKTYDEINNAVEGVAADYVVARGVATFPAGTPASQAITTGLTTITGYSATVESSIAAEVNKCVHISGTRSSGTLTLYRWKVTGPSTATLIAATAAGTVSWVAVGT
jgi:hypothetical protein